MNICAFGKYKVSYTNKYDYVSEYDWDMQENVYSHDKSTWKRTMQGGELIDFIAKLLKEKDVIDFSDKDNSIFISTFDSWNGTGEDIRIKYMAVK